MRVYLLILFLVLSCAQLDDPNRPFWRGPAWRGPAWRGPASSFQCKDLIENILGSHSLKDEKKYLLRLEKKLGRLELEETEYLEKKLLNLQESISARRGYLSDLKKKTNVLDAEIVWKEIELLENRLSTAPATNRLRSLRTALEKKGFFNSNQEVAMKDVIAFMVEELDEVSVKKIGKQTPINSQYAGTRYPMERLSEELQGKYPHGVWFDREGFPLFAGYASRVVDIEVSGAGRFDFLRANVAAGLERVPDDMTWHHHQNGKSMVLMPRDIHDAIRHTGGVAFVTKKIQRVKGTLPAGTEWAGKLYPLENLPPNLRVKYPRSVRYKVNGHPNLSSYAAKEVKIVSTKKRQLDFRLANSVAGIEGLPPGMTWHLKEDGETMQMVPRDLLKAIPNTPLW